MQIVKKFHALLPPDFRTVIWRRQLGLFDNIRTVNWNIFIKPSIATSCASYLAKHPTTLSSSATTSSEEKKRGETKQLKTKLFFVLRFPSSICFLRSRFAVVIIYNYDTCLIWPISACLCVTRKIVFIKFYLLCCLKYKPTFTLASSINVKPTYIY